MSDIPNPKFSPGEPAIVDMTQHPIEPGPWWEMHGWRVVIVERFWSSPGQVWAYITLPPTGPKEPIYRDAKHGLSEVFLRPLPPEESILKVVTENIPVPAQIPEDCPF